MVVLQGCGLPGSCLPLIQRDAAASGAAQSCTILEGPMKVLMCRLRNLAKPLRAFIISKLDCSHHGHQLLRTTSMHDCVLQRRDWLLERMDVPSAIVVEKSVCAEYESPQHCDSSPIQAHDNPGEAFASDGNLAKQRTYCSMRSNM